MKRKLWIILALAALIAALCVGTALADTNGNINSDITWTLSSGGVLTINGTGAIPDYGTAYNLSPFDGNTNIREVVVEGGMDVLYHMDHRRVEWHQHDRLYSVECGRELFQRHLDKHLHRCQYRLDFLHHVDQRRVERHLHDSQHRLERRDVILLRDMDEHIHRCQYGLDLLLIVDRRCMEWNLLYREHRFQRHQNDDLRGVDFYQNRCRNRMERLLYLDQRYLDGHQQQGH